MRKCDAVGIEGLLDHAQIGGQFVRRGIAAFGGAPAPRRCAAPSVLSSRRSMHVRYWREFAQRAAMASPSPLCSRARESCCLNDSGMGSVGGDAERLLFDEALPIPLQARKTVFMQRRTSDVVVDERIAVPHAAYPRAELKEVGVSKCSPG